MEVEAVDIVLANQHRQSIGNGLHSHTHFAGADIVNTDMCLWAVEGQVILYIKEQSAGIGRCFDLLSGLV